MTLHTRTIQIPTRVAGRTSARKGGSGRKRSNLILSSTALAVVALASFGVGACSSPSPKPDSSPSVSSPPPSETASPQPAPTWPLTGVDTKGDGAWQSRPAVSVKVENSVNARPQSGLEQADLVWEELIEGGYTRFNAVFHSQLPQEVGPIRSVRPTDIALTKPIGGMLVYSGGQPAIEAMVAQHGLRGFNEDQSVGQSYRVGFRAMPHNLYLDTLDMVKVYSEGLEAPAKLWAYPQAPDEQPSAVSAGAPITQLNVNFPSVQAGWSWNGSAWARSDMGVPGVARSGSPILADNVVVMMVDVHATGYYDGAGSPVMDSVLVTSGTGYVATEGKWVAVNWSKSADDQPVQLSVASGASALLKPGKTWVELVPKEGGAVNAS